MGAKPKTATAATRDVHASRLRRTAEGLGELGVSAFWHLSGAYAAEIRVREWLAARGLHRTDLVYRLGELLAEDMTVVRASSVQEAFINLAMLHEDGRMPDAFDDVVSALRRRRVLDPGVKASLRERRRDVDLLDALAFSKSLLRGAGASLSSATAGDSRAIADLRRQVARHVDEMRRRGRSAAKQGLVLWAERIDRRSRDPEAAKVAVERDPLVLERLAEAIRKRVERATKSAGGRPKR